MSNGEAGKLLTTRRVMLAMTLATVGAGARAQTTEAAYPNRPVRIIVPAAAGGPTDVMARVVSEGLNARFGQAVIVVNRAGAGGNNRRQSRRGRRQYRSRAGGQVAARRLYPADRLDRLLHQS